jgi:ComF family protein
MHHFSLLDRVLTPRCRLCGAACSTKQGAVLCAACHAGVFAPRTRCPQCALPTPSAQMCGQCLATPPAYDATRCAADYDDASRALLLDFKFNQQPGLATFLATELQRAVLGTLGEQALDAIVPVPLARERLKARGYNQAWELARVLGEQLALPVNSSYLHRPLNTRPQSSLDLKERHKNMRGAFVCLQSVAGKHLLLVDDIMTSGATLNAAAATLKLHGAARVSCAVVMRTPYF